MNLVNSMKLLFGTAKFGAKKYAPEICIGVGVTGVVTATVMACCKTKKTEAIMEDTRAKLEALRAKKEDTDINVYRKELTTNYAQMTGKLIRNYALPAAIMGLSVGLIFKSYGIMRGRNIAMAASYAALDEQFNKYRKRVSAKVGEETEKDIYYGIEKEKMQVIELNEDGTSSKKKEEVPVVTDDLFGPFTRIFDSGNRGWDKNPIFTKQHLECAQRWMNDQLATRGVVSLNEVLTYLDYEPVREGVIWGWRYNKDNPCTIKFCPDTDVIRQANKRFNEGIESVVVLDFSSNIENLYDNWSKPAMLK